MDKLFLPCELALKLEKLGFKDDCFAFYEILKKVNDGYCFNNYAMWGGISQNISESDDYHLYITTNELYGYYDNILRAPTWQQAFDWFRKEHKLDAYIFSNNSGRFTIVVKDLFTMESKVESPFHLQDFYEEAREACLEKLIELCGTL